MTPIKQLIERMEGEDSSPDPRSQSQVPGEERAPSTGTFYRGYRIDYYQPPIPWRGADWQFTHADYDGPEDNRCGHAASYAEACAEIDIMEDGA